jgi:hypothetical protein
VYLVQVDDGEEEKTPIPPWLVTEETVLFVLGVKYSPYKTAVPLTFFAQKDRVTILPARKRLSSDGIL